MRPHDALLQLQDGMERYLEWHARFYSDAPGLNTHATTRFILWATAILWNGFFFLFLTPLALFGLLAYMLIVHPNVKARCALAAKVAREQEAARLRHDVERMTLWHLSQLKSVAPTAMMLGRDEISFLVLLTQEQERALILLGKRLQLGTIEQVHDAVEDLVAAHPLFTDWSFIRFIARSIATTRWRGHPDDPATLFS